MAYLFGAITQKEHGYLQEMISARNQIAHNSWTDLTEDDEDRFETIAQKAHDVLANYLEEANEGAIVPVIELGELDDMTSTENH